MYLFGFSQNVYSRPGIETDDFEINNLKHFISGNILQKTFDFIYKDNAIVPEHISYIYIPMCFQQKEVPVFKLTLIEVITCLCLMVLTLQV